MHVYVMNVHNAISSKISGVGPINSFPTSVVFLLIIQTVWTQIRYLSQQQMIHLLYLALFSAKIMGRSRGQGGGGGEGPLTPPPPSEKTQKYRVFQQYWSRSPEKSHSYQASIQCWDMIGRPAKRHLNGVLLVGR